MIHFPNFKKCVLNILMEKDWRKKSFLFFFLNIFNFFSLSFRHLSYKCTEFKVPRCRLHLISIIALFKMCNLQMCNKNVLKWDDILYYLILNINGDAFELNVLALDLRCTQCAFVSLWEICMGFNRCFTTLSRLIFVTYGINSFTIYIYFGNFFT